MRRNLTSSCSCWWFYYIKFPVRIRAHNIRIQSIQCDERSCCMQSLLLEPSSKCSIQGIDSVQTFGQMLQPIYKLLTKWMGVPTVNVLLLLLLLEPSKILWSKCQGTGRSSSGTTRLRSLRTGRSLPVSPFTYGTSHLVATGDQPNIGTPTLLHLRPMTT